MTPTLDDLHFLASPPGAALLTRLAAEDLSDANTLNLITRLKKDVPPEQARAALEMARLRLKAADKFGEAARVLFFTRAALEQASDPLVRHYRARQMAAQAQSVIDAGCGIGADALALAQAGLAVTGLDIDPVRVAIARYNAAALDLAAQFEVADVRLGLPAADAAFFDPARRDDTGRRLYQVEQYEPPLSTIQRWPHEFVVVKLSPGVDLTQVAEYGGCVEFISVDGDLKEAVLWRGGAASGRRATLLVNDAVYIWDNQHGRGGSQTLPYDTGEIILSQPRAWLVEPDPALIRAGLVQDVAVQCGGALLDDTIAYFTTDTKPDSPWVRAWEILDWLPFNLKRLRAYLNARQVGRVTVKKRGTAVTPDELLPKLKLKGRETRTLILTRCQGEQVVLICADIHVCPNQQSESGDSMD